MYTLFGIGGRIGRGGWWLGQFVLLLLAGLFFLLPIIKNIPIPTIHGNMSETEWRKLLALWQPHEVMALVVFYSWIWLSVTSKRLHDLGRSGLWAIIGLFPGAFALWHFYYCPGCIVDYSTRQIVAFLGMADYIIGPAFVFYCGSVTGDPEGNPYGPPPGKVAGDWKGRSKAAPNFAKLDDDFMEAYARDYAERQFQPTPPPSPEPRPMAPLKSSGPVFGKR